MIPDVDVVPATTTDLIVLVQDRAAFTRRMGSPTPAGWPEFPEALHFTIQRLSAHPEEAEWWMHFFLVNGLVVGSGGFVGPPRGGTVEIGYEIAPAHRRKHYGTGAAAALANKAFANSEVRAVIAHTLPKDGPSTKVLEGVGFTNEGEIKDPDQGKVWRWRLLRP